MSIEKDRVTIKNREQYLKAFPKYVRPEALKNILDIRKFEIDLYWKRAAYFWTFIGVAFAGYFALLSNPNPSPLQTKGQFTVITLGVMFSLCWYFVNRGSKFWQLNWEKHLDLMEDGLIGPLYKTTIQRDHHERRWWAINEQYPFSLSKLNILLSLFIFILWVVIEVNFVCENRSLFFCDWWNYYNALLILLVASTVLLFIYGRTGKGHSDTFKTHIYFDQRGFTEESKSDNWPV